MLYHVHAFVDGGYLRALADGANRKWAHPTFLALQVIQDPSIQSWGGGISEVRNLALVRTTYYDAPEKDPEPDDDLVSYARAVERVPDTQLGFGWLRPSSKASRRTQKAVDTLIAVDMLVGAFTGVFKVALLMAGDADFVPVVDEVKRRGVMVILATDPSHSSEVLQAAADRIFFIGPSQRDSRFPPMNVGTRTWPAGRT